MTGETQRLSKVQTGFSALPEGALLDDDRYEILEILEEGPEVNAYLVRDYQPLCGCPEANSAAQQTALDGTICSACGQPIRSTRLLREAADPARFNALRHLLEQGLRHPGLLLPDAAFLEMPYDDSERAYLVQPESAPTLAASISVPEELSQVLKWGLQLADAMALLHEQYICLDHTDLNRIAIEDGGRVARWSNLDDVVVIAPTGQSIASGRYAEDLQNLAQILLYLATGLAGQDPAVALGLPTEVKDVFARAMPSHRSPLRSAQEFQLALERALIAIDKPTSITMVVGRRSDIGRKRNLNEDGLLCLVMDQVTESDTQPLGLFAVADGLGGHSAGEIATQLALDVVRQKTIADLFSSAINPPDRRPGDTARMGSHTECSKEGRVPQPAAFKDWITDAISASNARVHECRLQTGTDMGNTIVVAAVVGNTAYIGNVGDSRAYVVTQRGIRQITTDHSLVARLVATGAITQDEARVHPQRNAIYRNIGDRPQVQVDVFTERLGPGHHLLLCSDGLTGMVADQQVFEIIRQSTSPQQACDQLVQAANDAGGADNITAIVVQILMG